MFSCHWSPRSWLDITRYCVTCLGSNNCNGNNNNNKQSLLSHFCLFATLTSDLHLTDPKDGMSSRLLRATGKKKKPRGGLWGGSGLVSPYVFPDSSRMTESPQGGRLVSLFNLKKNKHLLYTFSKSQCVF